jgi:ribosomal 50S subunit-recycling heat shock protein
LRVDKYLNAVNITKNRNISQDMIKSGVVFINGSVAKASKELKEGDILEIKYLESSVKYKILQIPKSKTTPKSKKFEYIEEIN